MKRLKQSFMVFFCMLLMVVSIKSYAITLAELYENDKVRIKVWIEPEENIIARQQVNLQIEVATDKWFSGGTKIGHFEVKDAVVLQREKFAVNSIREEGEKTWTIQQWTLVVYPQRDGVFEVPAIPLQLSIAGDGAESVVGEIFTQPISFAATIPEQVDVGSGWIATNRFEIDESFNKTPDELGPGDALIRTINISADNLPAMMLPKVTVDDIPGIAVYAKPPLLLDKANRGDYIAERSQTITYVFENTGEYLLPKQTFFWWNLASQSYDSIELEEHVLTISSTAKDAGAGEQAPQQIDENWFVELIPVFKKTGLVLLLLIGIWIVVRRLSRGFERNKTIEPVQLSEAVLRKQFEKACGKNDMENAIRLFYQWLDHYGGDAFECSIRESLDKLDQEELTMSFKEIMQSVFSEQKGSSVDIKRFADQFVSELKKNSSQTILGHLSVDLKLN